VPKYLLKLGTEAPKWNYTRSPAKFKKYD